MYDTLTILTDGIIALQDELDSPGDRSDAPQLFTILDELIETYATYLSEYINPTPEELS